MSYITHKKNILSDLVKYICHLPVMPPPGILDPPPPSIFGDFLVLVVAFVA